MIKSVANITDTNNIMPYDISWWKQDHVLYIRLYGVITLDDLEQVTQRSIEALRTTPNVVHAITDTLEIETLPNNIAALMRNMKPQRQPNSGYTIIVSGNKLVRFIANTLLQVLQMDIRLVTTLDDAKIIVDKLGV
jgi:hypothetical protein